MRCGMAFWKLKALLQTAAEQAISGLLHGMARVAKAFSPREGGNFLPHADHVQTWSESVRPLLWRSAATKEASL
jgi:hypothetical protein